MMTNNHPSGLARRFRHWIAAHRRRRDECDALLAIEHLDDHLARDAGLHRLPAVGPRRSDPCI